MIALFQNPVLTGSYVLWEEITPLWLLLTSYPLFFLFSQDLKDVLATAM